MSNKNKIIVTVFILLCAAMLLSWLVLGGERTRQDKFFVFNTPCSVTFWGRSEASWDAALAELLPRLQSLNDCLNIYEQESELSRLNASANETPFKCSEQLWNVLLATREAWKVTEHAYDPSVGPLMRIWGFHEDLDTIPTEEEIDAALEKVGLEKVVFDDAAHTVFFTVSGMSLDCGGIAKGYGCDVAAEIFEKHGIRKYLLDLGGNLLLSKATPKGKHTFNVGIRDPMKKGSVIRSMQLKGRAVATSGNYERSRVIDGKRIGHIMDPATGHPNEFHAGVTAITTMGVESDTFSTAVFIRGAALAEKLAKVNPANSFIIIDENGTTTIGE